MISLYKERKELFFNRSIKKSLLWKEITKKLADNGFGNPSVAQVEDKFKNLRRNYSNVKDAIGPNSSGAPAPEKFKYFDEIDEILAKNPNFDPPLIIGSHRAQEIVEIDSEQPNKISRTMDNNTQTKKIPKTQNIMERILNAQEVAHREILKEMKLSREIFSEKIEKLIEKLDWFIDSS